MNNLVLCPRNFGLNHSTSISSKLLNTLGSAAKIVGRPIGAINGAYEYYKNK
jgi:hypothetical protein